MRQEWNFLNKARTFMWGKMYRRRLFLEYAIEQPCHAYEDVATTPYILTKVQSTYHVPKGLYYYLRNRQGSIVNDFSSLRDLLQSLEELMHRFQADGSFSAHRIALRQLFWGQIAFVHRSLRDRFPTVEAKKKETLKRDAMAIACQWFPELAMMPTYRFFVPSQDLRIVEALKHLVLDENCILHNDNATLPNFSIVFHFENDVCNYGKRIILESPMNATEDMEYISWDLADEIFKKIWGGAV